MARNEPQGVVLRVEDAGQSLKVTWSLTSDGFSGPHDQRAERNQQPRRAKCPVRQSTHFAPEADRTSSAPSGMHRLPARRRDTHRVEPHR